MPRHALLTTLTKRSGAVAVPSLGSVTIANMGTTVTNDLSPDGFTWAAVQGAFAVDSFGKWIIYAQRYNSNTRQCYFVVSNNAGTSWADNTGISGGEGFLTRGDIVYDAGRDCFHSLIVTTNPSDGGIIYRRYTITRDGSNNITSIARVAGVSVLDDAGANNSNGLEFPTIFMSDANTLIAAWTVKTTAPGGEIRACKCNLTGNADAGGTATNWVHLGVNSTTTIGAAPAVGSYTIPFTQGTANALTYFSVRQLASGDLRWVYHSGNNPGTYRTRRSIKSGANTWGSLSTPVDIVNLQRAGTDTGYSLKNQLISQVTEDASGNSYVGLATWKDNTNGDTWGIYKLSSADAVSGSRDLYSAGGAHSYAPTGDAAYDATSGQVVATYLKSTTLATVAQLVDASALTLTGSEVSLGTTADIPLILSVRTGGKLLFGWRVEGAPPQVGRFGTATWS